MDLSEIREQLMSNGLKITPQRIAVLEAIIHLNNHPTADNIIEHIKVNHPNIAIGTVYKCLETLVEKGLIDRVTTERNIMRYDPITRKHHHLYFTDSDRIEDFYDDELNKIIENYFREKNIPNFIVEDVKIQIVGNFDNKI